VRITGKSISERCAVRSEAWSSPGDPDLCRAGTGRLLELGGAHQQEGTAVLLLESLGRKVPDVAEQLAYTDPRPRFAAPAPLCSRTGPPEPHGPGPRLAAFSSDGGAPSSSDLEPGPVQESTRDVAVALVDRRRGLDRLASQCRGMAATARGPRTAASGEIRASAERMALTCARAAQLCGRAPARSLSHVGNGGRADHGAKGA